MAHVTLKQLCKTYGDVVALDAMDLEIEDGEFVSVLGPSGSGKSTMLKLIAGIDEVSGGRILFDDRDVTQMPPERRDIAMVFQSYALYPTMTVFENIAFPLRLRRLPRVEIRKRVEEVAELLGITALLKRRPRQLSGGERQRTAIGRAMVRNPKVFLFDEPLSNLDAHLRAGMRQELMHLHRLLHTTFIYVTHDQDDALDMGERIAVLDGGRLQQFASSAELYEEPANRFVASFVGHPPMNLLHGQLLREAGEPVFRSQTLSFPLDQRSPPPEAAGDVVLGLRPEWVTVASGSDGRPAGVVESISALGYQRLYATLRIGDSTLIARVPEGTRPPAIGESIGLEIDSSRAHFFDVQGGRPLLGRKTALVELGHAGAGGE